MTFDISKIHIPSNPGIYLMKDYDKKLSILVRQKI